MKIRSSKNILFSLVYFLLLFGCASNQADFEINLDENSKVILEFVVIDMNKNEVVHRENERLDISSISGMWVKQAYSVGDVFFDGIQFTCQVYPNGSFSAHISKLIGRGVNSEKLKGGTRELYIKHNGVTYKYVVRMRQG